MESDRRTPRSRGQWAAISRSGLAALAVALVTAACSGPLYAPRQPNAGTATLEVAVASHGLVTDVWVFLDDRCEKGPGAGRLVRMPRGPTVRSYEIEAGRPLFVRGYGSDPTRLKLDCIVMAQLTPVAGRTYRLTHTSDYRQVCRFELVDSGSGRFPTEARSVPVRDECLSNLRRWED